MMGAEPFTRALEAGAEVVIAGRSSDTSITAAAARGGLYLAVPGLQDSTVSNLAFPYSPRHIPRGKVFRFNLNHVVEPADPCEMFPLEL